MKQIDLKNGKSRDGFHSYRLVKCLKIIQLWQTNVLLHLQLENKSPLMDIIAWIWAYTTTWVCWIHRKLKRLPFPLFANMVLKYLVEKFHIFYRNSKVSNLIVDDLICRCIFGFRRTIGKIHANGRISCVFIWICNSRQCYWSILQTWRSTICVSNKQMCSIKAIFFHLNIRKIISFIASCTCS